MLKRNSDILLAVARMMLSPFLRQRLNVAVAATLEILAVALGVAGPFLLKCLVDTLSETVSTTSVAATPAFLSLVAAFVVAWCGGSLVATIRMVFTARVIDGLNAELATRTLRSQLPGAGRRRDGDSGQVLGILERLPFSLNIVCEGMLWRTVPLILQAGISLAIVARLVPARYLVIMILMLLGFVAASWYGAVRQRQFATLTNTATGGVSQTLGDLLRNARRVALNGTMEREVGEVRGRFLEKRGATERMWWSLAQLAGLQYGAVGLGLMLLLMLGGMDVAAGRMTVGDFVLLEAYAIRLTAPLSGFGFTLSQAGVSLANLGEVLGLADIRDVSSETKKVELVPARITVDDLSFEYGPGLPGLRDVSFVLEPGSFNVIVGPNGSGKSTLAQLMAGVLNPIQGGVSLNGQALSAIPSSERYRHIMYVPQFIGLFHRTLGDNALYPPTRHSSADLEALLTEWRFYDAGRPIDLTVIVGEQGERLSGGQIQKLELARLAGVKVPAIIFDESTSSLDPASEERVIDSLMVRYGAQTTMVLITHRARLAEYADQVLFMREGRLVASGRHKDLLATSADYRHLWSGTVPGSEQAAHSRRSSEQ